MSRQRAPRGKVQAKPRWSGLETQYHPGGGGVDEILRPTLLSVGGSSCYRLVKSSWPWDEEKGEGFGSNREGAGAARKKATHEDTYDEGDDPLSELEEGMMRLPDGLYSISLPIPAVFFKYIIGYLGRVRENIQRDTKCNLTLPNRGREGSVVITGETVSAVAHAKRRVEMVAWTNRFKEEPTHFISIPLNSPRVMEQFSLFKTLALTSCGKDQGIQEGAFKTPKKLHLTLGVMRIFSWEEENKAIKILQRVVSDAKMKLGSEPVPISLRGLDCMSDDITAARVVYAKVNSSPRLQDFVDDINSGFISEGPEMMQREYERVGVKLHATVLNSLFLERLEEGGRRLEVYRGKRRDEPWMTIDAKGILKEFKDYDFGEVQLSSIHLSKRSEVDSNGYYKCVHECLI